MYFKDGLPEDIKCPYCGIGLAVEDNDEEITHPEGIAPCPCWEPLVEKV